MNLDFLKAKAPPLFGLDISSSSVKMLEIVEAGKGAYRVERYIIEALPKDAVVDGNINIIEAVADAVTRGYKRLATRTKHVAMAVPSGAVITKKIIVQAGLREDGTVRTPPPLTHDQFVDATRRWVAAGMPCP